MSLPIVIAAGHSNSDPGAPGQGISEQVMMAELRNIVAMKLRGMGERVLTDGDSKRNLSLAESIQLIRQGRIAVELHVNSAANPTATGVECFSLPRHKDVSQQLCRAVAHVLELGVRGKNGGWKPDTESARGKLGYVQSGGLVLEVFFASNPKEHAIYQARKWLVAQAIADVLKDAP